MSRRLIGWMERHQKAVIAGMAIMAPLTLAVGMLTAIGMLGYMMAEAIAEMFDA